MQKCSELGKNSMAWQHFVRFGQSNLKVKKGPEGHYLESRCREELEKRLPAESFKELMVFVANWLKRLDEKNGIVRPAEEESPQEPKDKHSDKDVHVEKGAPDKTPADPSVVDLCSDEEDASAERFSDKETLDCESVISSSSLVILDEELGEVNLKDYADHVDGKLDETSLRKRKSREEDNTPSKATKQTSMKAFLIPNERETETDESPSPVLRRSLKTYVRRSKIAASGENPGKDVQTSSEKRSSLILRELNPEGKTNLNSSSKEESTAEVIVIEDLSQEDKLEPPIGEKSKPKNVALHDTKPKPSIEEKLNGKAMKNIETPPCVPLKCNEIKAKSATDVNSNASMKCETKVPLGEAKENSEPNAKNEGQKPNVIKPAGVKTMPLLTGLLLADPPPQEEANQDSNPVNPEVQPNTVINQRAEPNAIRIRNDLVSTPMEAIRVRTDLLQEQVNPVAPPNPPAQPSNPPGVAEKRKLPTVNDCESTLPKRPAVDNFNPAITTSRYTPSIPVSAAPVNTPRYRLIAPAPASSVANVRYPQSTAAPAAASSYPPVIPTAPLTMSNYQPNRAPIAPFNRGYPPTNAAIAPRMNNSSYPVRYPPEVPATAGGATNKSYPLFRPVLPGATNTVWYPPPGYPPAVLAPVTTSYQPVCPPVSCSSSTFRGPSTVPSSAPGSTPLARYRPPKPAPVVATSYQPVMSAVVGSANAPRYPPPPAVVGSANTPRYPPSARIVATSYQPVMSAVVGSANATRYPPPPPVVTSIKPAAPAPVASSSYQPNTPAAPQQNQNKGSTDFSKVMGMLGQVELYAFGQKNQEAFHLVHQLRLSIQKAEAEAPQRNV
nr:adhesive plaque matrix protein [Drosophila takahashii]